MTATTTASVPLQSARPHEHGWIIESQHPTSEGKVVYVRCAECGIRRIDVQRAPDQPPQALSREAPVSVRPRASQRR